MWNCVRRICPRVRGRDGDVLTAKDGSHKLVIMSANDEGAWVGNVATSILVSGFHASTKIVHLFVSGSGGRGGVPGMVAFGWRARTEVLVAEFVVSGTERTR